MLQESTTILTSVVSTPSPYACQIIFANSSKAKYLNIGDVLEDNIGNTYTIDNHSFSPSDFESGGVVSLTALGDDVLPATFSQFGDSLVYTPGQADIRPRVNSGGLISGATVISGASFTYNVVAAWTNATLVAIGDKIADSTGKLYSITTINQPNATDINVVEDALEGETPTPGSASIFTPTSNYSLYQGSKLTDQARTKIRSRDNYYLDQFLKDVDDNSGGVGGPTDRSEIEMLNSTGSAMAKGTPVYVELDGSMAKALPDSDSLNNKSHVIGVLKANTINGAIGIVVIVGRVEDVTVGGDFGDYIYLSTSGALTEVKPDPTSGYIDGDAVVKLGKLIQNESNGLSKDLLVEIDHAGFL